MSERPLPLLSMAAIVFVVAVLATLSALRGARSGPRHADGPRAEDRPALACAALHPDPEISGAFVRSVRRADIALEFADLSDGATGTFDAPAGRPIIRIDESLAPAGISAKSCEPLLATLSHEIVHYDQWSRGASKDLLARLNDGRTLNESQCVLKVMIEIEAYTLSCLRIQRYGWKSGLGQCDAIDIPYRASRELAQFGAAIPECAETWDVLSREGARMKNATLKTRKASKPVTRSHGTYLAPP